MPKKTDNLRKSPNESETIMTEVVCPNDTNPMGFLQGGRLVQWMDIASAVTAQTHSGRICVTASIDKVDFITPAKIGDIITIKARITRTFNSSMEIKVKAWARKVLTGKNELINEAYFTFVAFDENSHPVKISGIEIQTNEEKTLFKQAGERKLHKQL